VSSAEMVLGVPVRLPGEFHTTSEPACDLVEDDLPRAASYAEVADTPPAHLSKARFVYVRRGGCVPPLAPVYSGPFEVLTMHAKTFTLRVGDKSEVVSVDRLKPHTGPGPVLPASQPARGRSPAVPRVQPAPP
jgi:hypothetical protein